MHLDSRFQTEDTAGLVGTFTEDLDLFRDGRTRTHQLRATRASSLVQLDVSLPFAGWCPLGWVDVTADAPDLFVAVRYAHLADDSAARNRVVARVLDLIGERDPAVGVRHAALPPTEAAMSQVVIHPRKTRCHLGI